MSLSLEVQNVVASMLVPFFSKSLRDTRYKHGETQLPPFRTSIRPEPGVRAGRNMYVS